MNLFGPFNLYQYDSVLELDSLSVRERKQRTNNKGLCCGTTENERTEDRMASNNKENHHCPKIKILKGEMKPYYNLVSLYIQS